MSVFVGDIGVQFKLNATIDLSSQTTLQIKYQKPDKTTGFWVATVSGTNYAVYTTKTENDLDDPGTWILQIYVITPTYTAHGKKALVYVEPSVF